MSQVDQKRAFNKLKHELEPWRNLIVQLNSVLIWEKNFYPAIICVFITAFFLILWLLDLTVVTMLSLAGLIIVAFDTFYPVASRFFFNSENWSSVDEENFENVCTQLCGIKTFATTCINYVMNSKEHKSTIFTVVASSVLILLAWLGSVINNLLLMYLLLISIALYPGLRKRCVIGAVKEKFGSIVKDKLK